MASGISGRAQLRNQYGPRIDRAAANLPATTSGNLFQVIGGRVLVTTITGVVTTAIQAQANAVKLQAANAGATIVTDLCATVDINGLAAGNLLGITGTTTAAAVVGQAVIQNNEVIVNTGFIRLNTAATNTGQMSWSLTYIPLDDGAYVVAV
jgi:hypothetical protein